MKKTFIIMAGFLTTLLGAADLKVGDAAPDFALKGSDGKTYKLSDYKGKQAVVIAWFPKAFTGGLSRTSSASPSFTVILNATVTPHLPARPNDRGPRQR